MWTIFNVFIEFVTTLLLFHVCFFGHEACGILALCRDRTRNPCTWKVKS